MLEFHLFGAPDLRRAGEGPILSVLTGSKRLALLAYLVLQGAGVFVRRDALLALLWPESDARRARGALRNLLYQLRRALGEGVVAGRGREEIGIAEGTLRCDVWTFEEALAREAWEDALDVYRGRLLTGYHLSGASQEFERWLDGRREELHRLAVEAASHLVRDMEAAGRVEDAARWARRVVGLAPTDVRAARHLVELLVRANRPGAAERELNAFTRRFRQELGMDPPPELRELAADLHRSVTGDGPPSDRRREHASESRVGTGVQEAEPRRFEGSVTGRAVDTPTIAVLPFHDLSPAGDQSHLAHGLAEEILNALTQLRALRVAARTSSFAYGDGERDVREVGEELGVAHLLEGSVRKTGSRIRVTAQLVDTGDGFHLWSETYDRELSDVFQIQEEIASSVVDALRVELLKDERARLRRVEGVDPEAYELFLRGRDYWNRRHAVGLGIALEHFEKALERDPDFPLALDGVAYALVALGAYGLVAPDRVRDRILELSRRALELDPDLPEAHTTLGFYRILFEYDWEAGFAGVRRAVQIDDSYVRAHVLLGLLSTLRAGRPPGVLPEPSRRALELAPQSEWVRTTVGHTCIAAGLYEVGLHHHEQALEIEPESVPALLGRGITRTMTGRPDAGLEDLDRACALTNRAPFFVALRGGMMARIGRSEEAGASLEELGETREDRYVDPIMLGMIEAPLGEGEAALERVAACVRLRSPSLFTCLLMPPFESSWEHPRWSEILEPAGFEFAPEASRTPEDPPGVAGAE